MTILGALVLLAAQQETPVDFNRDVRPLLSANCFFCHGPDAGHRKAGLRLDTADGLRARLKKGGHAVVPGKPGESALIARIRHADPDKRMPPGESGKKLEPAEIAILERWVREGATYKQAWAYVPPKRVPVPKVRRADWAANWIDRFILARLEREGLAPAPDADPVTLLRRLSFDLVGLPPEPAEVDAFVKSRDYEKQVDRLLASERFGERLAAYWLDLVRYADTVGYHGDQDHNISPYRDYVIRAFNANMRFDRFTREQLAGDLLADPTEDQIVATGYNRLLQTSHEGGVQPREYLAIYGADRVRNISGVWMGATMGCCQCHNHKYDPYTMRDFYSMKAFFADIDEAAHFKKGTNSLPTARPPEIAVYSDAERREVAALDAEIRKLNPKKDKKKIAALRKRRDRIGRKTMITVALEKPRVTRILPRGNWLDDSGDIVEPAVPGFLGNLGLPRRATRLDLANWLTDPKRGVGGLTARVFANRAWYLLFGTGLSKSLDDFGNQGEPPVHPELLDALALEFQSHWDVKRLLKLIVMSRAYRQSSVGSPAAVAKDPENRLWARQSRWRLPAEMVRDTALTIGGLLVHRIGGPSVKPYQPAGYYRHLNFPPRKYTADRDERQWRRGVYVHWQRQFLHPMMRAFDAPTREECTAERPRSNTPVAALTLLNDPTFVEAARAFAARILGGAKGDRLEFAFRVAVSRPPDETERMILDRLLKSSRKRYDGDPEAVRKLLGVGLAKVPERIAPAELASWTMVARTLLNMNETLTRN